ncbi:E3 ubiquitin-protein ligase RGLG2 [Cucumis melo var. makuwa]|uniref:E3 ubiquitin-protein ligase RGLG2 n=1 Tax=Cucumis melo var. makuwa TaxID=1194695 RepID=A0A5A7T5F6_CUCMM|nr:E3 ubiquitin-protein ligase RGLG2 [Cucumis melo var. makuwa]TYJ95904.1 E3 ubiquitin-protein ligase RGLG2 [Cucumis melo var. makuwa]
MRLRKLEAPIFKREEQENPDGEALDWYQWEEEWELIASWKKFRELFLDRFQSAEEADPQLKELGQKALKGKFVAELKKKIPSEMPDHPAVCKLENMGSSTTTITTARYNDSRNTGGQPHQRLMKEVMLSKKKKEEGDTEGETNQNDDGVVEVRDDKEVAHFSLNLMAELSSPQTVKVKGLVKGLEVVALVDGGATHNFIDKELVTSRFSASAIWKRRHDIGGVMVGDVGQGHGGLPHVSHGIVLGDWLVLLRGHQSLATSQITLRAMMKTMKTGDQGLWIELSTVEQMATKGR